MERRTRRKFTQEYKAEVVNLVRTSGKSVVEVAREMGLTESVLRNWVRQSEIDDKRNPRGPLTTEERAEMARLRRELRTVTMERDFLKNYRAPRRLLLAGETPWGSVMEPEGSGRLLTGAYPSP